jgi:hypothetical protein
MTGFVNASAGVGKAAGLAEDAAALDAPLAVGPRRVGNGPTSHSSSHGRIRSRMKWLINA